ncbi:MAG: hypothetical protein DRI84_01790 [Bacteroidetes bacterium]|nr:MAG: hypothetical protein DRI84_01790 [Bacteroidota bacterium]
MNNRTEFYGTDAVYFARKTCLPWQVIAYKPKEGVAYRFYRQGIAEEKDGLSLYRIWCKTYLFQSASVENVKFEACEVLKAREFAFANDCFECKRNEEVGVLSQAPYPNPASDMVTIEFSNDTFENVNAQLKVYTITGRLIYETQFNTNNSIKVLSVDMLKNGVYIYRISISNGIDKSGKLVILKQ